MSLVLLHSVIANQELTTINLVAAESMEKSQLLQIGSVMKD